MAEALTYNSLLSDIALYANRNDSEFIAQLPRFVMLAENRIATEVKGLGLIRFANFNMTDNTSVYNKPARWRQTASMAIQSGTSKVYLKQRGLEYLQTYWPDSSLKDAPEFYSDYDYEHWLIAPTPDATYVATVGYYERPLPLDDQNQTNWTTQYAPQLLIYASLLEAQPFLKTPERIQEFQMMYERAANAISKENLIRTVDRSSKRSE